MGVQPFLWISFISIPTIAYADPMFHSQSVASYSLCSLYVLRCPAHFVYYCVFPFSFSITFTELYQSNSMWLTYLVSTYIPPFSQ